jgi:peptide-methionine (S)-S-oxide reductase
VVRTRVGYAGGTSPDPTYRSLGDHAETIQIDFDPRRISYGELLEVFWSTHNPCARPWSRQYMSAIFYHDEQQAQRAVATMKKIAVTRGAKVHTLLARAGTFYLAEDYHQKYRLRQHPDLVAEYLAVYPKLHEFVNSTAAARVNGYLGGHGSLADLENDLPRLGLSKSAASKLLVAGRRRLSR